MARICAVDYRAGRSVREIAEEYGIGWQTVYAYLRRFGVPRRGNVQAANRRAIILDLYDRRRLTAWQIAQILPYSHKNIRYHLLQTGRQP